MRRMLLVSGEEYLRQSVEKAMEKEPEDYELTISTRPDEVFRKLEKDAFAYDIMVIDSQLPGISGLDLCKKLQPYQVLLPRILLLEKGMEALGTEVLKYGVHDYIIKDEKKEYLRRLTTTLTKVLLNFENCIVRRELAAAIKETEEKFQKAFMLSPNPMAISVLNDGRILEINENGVKQFGYTREEIIGKTLIQVGTIKPKDLETIKKLSMEKDSFNNLEMKFYTRSGEERICLISGQLITIGGEICIIQSISDITQQKRMQKELLKSKNLESIGVLAGGIARDFNDYLTSIMGNISMAKMSLHDAGKIHKALIRAEEISIQAADLASKMLTLSNGGAPIYRKSSISSIIKDIIDYSFRQIDSDVICKYRKDTDVWPVYGDETQLHQLIYSLLLNALEAMPNGGEALIQTRNITISTGNELALNEGNYVKVTIKDNGVGIPEKNLDRIFDPFFSTKDTISRNGVGLGLTICQSIVSKHNGCLEVNSTVGQGTTVNVYLPAFEEKSY
jgi:two-component system cell cycle sensor histidine kinase/response regulator CckA